MLIEIIVVVLLLRALLRPWRMHRPFGLFGRGMFMHGPMGGPGMRGPMGGPGMGGPGRGPRF